MSTTPNAATSRDTTGPGAPRDAAGTEHGHAEPVAVSRPTTVTGRVVAAPIVAYRRWVSPVIPARCRFYPTCSTYALEAVAVHGAGRGIWLAIRRLLRCHPFHPGGYDPVPPPKRRNGDPSP
jgi:putative membrane protein insertion efficiency factor